jgi:phospholipase/lecithinase/hemolysin
MAVLALGASLVLGVASEAGQISGIVSFGDSLSDVGNDFIGSKGTEPDPAADYYQGHFSNGPIWLEYLAQNLGVATPTPALAGGTDYAFGGAQTGPGFSTFVGAQVPNIDTQIGMYLAANTPSASQLFTLWGGANDVLYGSSPNPMTSLANIAGEITPLAQAGAKQFLVGNLPPLNLIPAASGLTSTQQQGLALFTQYFNQGLQAELAQLQQGLGVQIHLLDVNSLFNSAVADPAQYGFTNVTGFALNPQLSGNGYLFWDPYHPTTDAGELIGALGAQSVPEPSSLVLLGIALGGLGAWRSSRHHGQKRRCEPTSVIPDKFRASPAP